MDIDDQDGGVADGLHGARQGSHGVLPYSQLDGFIEGDAEMAQEWTRVRHELMDSTEDLTRWEVLTDVLTRIIDVVELRLSQADPEQRAASRPILRQAVADVYKDLLSRFPLLYGFWLKYLELEGRFGDSQSVRKIHERSVSAFPVSVELWVAYGAFLVPQRQQTLSVKDIRGTLVRGLRLAGRNFLSHGLWDMYIEFENEVEPWSSHTARALKSAMDIPLHQYAKYYEQIAANDLVKRYPDIFGPDYDLAQVVNRTAQATNSRWVYESKITRSYFDAVPVEPEQLANWRDYVNFEMASTDLDESAGSRHAQTVQVFERCLVVCGLYDEFWLMYTRWLVGEANSTTSTNTMQEIRNVFRRACTQFVPISRPLIRFQWAIYEESIGEYDYAQDIYQSVQDSVDVDVSDVEDAYLYRIAYERRRQGDGGCRYAQQLYDAIVFGRTANEMEQEQEQQQEQQQQQQHVQGDEMHVQGNEMRVQGDDMRLGRILGVVVVEMARSEPDTEARRAVYRDNRTRCVDSAYFYINYMKFEGQQALRDKARSTERLDQVWEFIVTRTQLPVGVTRDLSLTYLEYLESCGNRARWVQVDAQVSGPFSVQTLYHQRLQGVGMANM